MALPPTIPTSFVPKQPVTATKRRSTGSNPFLALAYIILGLAVIGCGLVFGYQYYLDGVAKKKANDVLAAQNQIDQATVTEFIRLRDRFTAAKDILNRHVVLSQYFDVLENLTLQGVRFNSLKMDVLEDRRARIDMAGTARSFNTLAAQSQSFATDKRIKRAIFSGINVTSKDNSVGFDLTAELDPTLVVANTSAAAPSSADVQTVPSSATTTTP